MNVFVTQSMKIHKRKNAEWLPKKPLKDSWWMVDQLVRNTTLIKSFSYSDQFNVHSFIFVGPKETSGFKVSFPQGTRLRLKVPSARECIK